MPKQIAPEQHHHHVQQHRYAEFAVIPLRQRWAGAVAQIAARQPHRHRKQHARPTNAGAEPGDVIVHRQHLPQTQQPDAEEEHSHAEHQQRLALAIRHLHGLGEATACAARALRIHLAAVRTVRCGVRACLHSICLCCCRITFACQVRLTGKMRLLEPAVKHPLHIRTGAWASSALLADVVRCMQSDTRGFCVVGAPLHACGPRRRSQRYRATSAVVTHAKWLVMHIAARRCLREMTSACRTSADHARFALRAVASLTALFQISLEDGGDVVHCQLALAQCVRRGNVVLQMLA